ncbi:M61 family metallopeptidase [Rhodocytophaga rosea]|uniref:M61 family metallopeptidase n=1 Tax=Rhodocytophaga rosea TaxID=2704465 RepID=A0A6C0GDB6_9BACT|nr:PDZ domain-containing protein [Rhodocytophaga rosea]QHT65965.1 M61 family metallopeptidase [Rhodocytophaga rosea]
MPVIFSSFSRLYHSLFLFVFVASSQIVNAQKIQYEISFDNAAHHEAQINVSFTNLTNKPLEVVMSRSSPGRYALHEFAKHVYALEARNSKDQKLQVSRPSPYQWNISGHDGTVRLTYTLFGNRADGTYTGINALFAVLNMPATFMWAHGLEKRPIEVRFRLPEGQQWKVATQLKSEKTPNTFSAPHLQYFLDSPTIVGNYTLREWLITEGGKEKTIQLALLHNGTEAEADQYASLVKKVVSEQKAVYGELPEYDFGKYTFLAAYSPYVSGDGMEHRNSTVCTSTHPLATNALDNLGTISHEFFHAWNVERIRPKSLEPFDFERANMSGELWFAEGFTTYYGNLILSRTGEVTLEQYTRELAANLDYMLRAPGRKLFSAVEMSQQAPFVDAAVSIEPNNRSNTYLSYYNFGDMIALALDLSLRKEFKNLTLDDYMRLVWKKFGKSETPYTMADLRTTLGELTGNQTFANTFYSSFIEGKETAPYKSLLAQAGMLLENANPGQASLGYVALRFSNEGAQIQSPVLRGSPLYLAGMESGDIILSIDGAKPTQENYKALLQQKKPGDTLSIVFSQMGKEKQTSVKLGTDEAMNIVLYEEAGMQVTEQIKSFRKSWLGSKSE